MSGFSGLTQRNGIWTPTITFGGNAVGVTYDAANSGIWLKTALGVLLSGTLRLTSKGSSVGNAEIRGIPFSSDGFNKFGGNIAFYANTTGLTGTLLLGDNVLNADTIALSQTSATGSALVTDAAITNTLRIDFSLLYISAT